MAALPTVGPRRRSRLGRLAGEPGLSFVVPLGAYVTGAVLLCFVWHNYFGDAVSRLANGYYAIYSRDPHLAAIGFVWNPLPTLASMPLLLLKPLWPALATHIFAGCLTSAVCMAGAAYHLRALLAELGVTRLARVTLVVAFAFNPMILYYGSNGMSEAIFLLTLLATCRYLTRWLRDGGVKSLVYAAAWLGAAYLARSEAVGAAAIAAIVVAGVSWTRHPGAWRRRLMEVGTDLAVFLLPFIVSVAAWAIASFVITGAPFAQFNSLYGTTSQLKILGNGGVVGFARLTRELDAIFLLAPALGAVALLCVMRSALARDVRFLGGLAVLGGALSFDVASYYVGGIEWSLRYLIAAVPLSIVAIGGIVAPRPRGRGPTTDLRAAPHVRRWTSQVVMAVVAFVVAGPSLPTTAAAMFDLHLGTEETTQLGGVFGVDARDPIIVSASHRYPDVVADVRYLDRMNLRRGDVVVDTFTPCVPDIVIGVRQPTRFVITNDRDFQRVLADPLVFHAHYLLVPPVEGYGTLDAVNRKWGGLYQNGGGIGRLVHQFSGHGYCPPYRLYRVVRHATQVTAGT